MAVLPNHSHCRYCGNPTPYGEEYCDDDCRALFKAEESMERDEASVAVSLRALDAGADIVRVHNVGMMRRALDQLHHGADGEDGDQ